MTEGSEAPRTIKTRVYVDGFNLYYGCLKNSDHKWLNLNRLCELLLPISRIEQIYYFTAKVSPTPDDSGKLIRQLLYIRALGTLPNVKVIPGLFMTDIATMQRADGSGPVEVVRSKEKRSDVNLACQLLCDAYEDKFDLAAIVTGDSDFCTPVHIVKNLLKKNVIILDPQGTPKSELCKLAGAQKPIRAGVLSASQFEITLEDEKGKFSKPQDWFAGETRKVQAAGKPVKASGDSRNPR